MKEKKKISEPVLGPLNFSASDIQFIDGDSSHQIASISGIIKDGDQANANLLGSPQGGTAENSFNYSKSFNRGEGLEGPKFSDVG